MTNQIIASTRKQLAKIAVGLLAGIWTISTSNAAENSCRTIAPTYPARPITLVVGFPAGGQTDLIGRIVADGLSRRLGQAVVVENKAGAGGNIGAASVARAEGDGLTLLLATAGTHAINAALYKSLPFDHIRDFKAVAFIVKAPNIFVVNPSLPVKSLTDLIQLAKEKPGKLNLALPGNGSSPHLSAELFKSMAGVDLQNVMYRGGAPALNDLIGGQVDVLVDAIMTALPHINAGTVRALAVTGQDRSPLLPDVPAVGEFLPGYEMNAWWGIVAPSRTPEPVVERLNCEINALLSDDKVKTRFTQIGATTIPLSTQAFTDLIASETAKWGKVIRAANIHME